MKVLQSPGGLYLRGAKAMLIDMDDWVHATRPSHSEIRSELHLLLFRLTADVNEADLFELEGPSGDVSERSQQELNEMKTYFPDFIEQEVFITTQVSPHGVETPLQA